MGGIGDPRRAVHVDADVVVPAPDSFPGVEAHPNRRDGPRRPVVGGQGALGGDRGIDRSPRGGEHDEEGVPMGIHLDPTALSVTPTLGMSSMRERAENIGARLVVQSAPNAGTRIHTELPIHHAD